MDVDSSKKEEEKEAVAVAPSSPEASALSVAAAAASAAAALAAVYSPDAAPASEPLRTQVAVGLKRKRESDDDQEGEAAAPKKSAHDAASESAVEMAKAAPAAAAPAQSPAAALPRAPDTKEVKSAHETTPSAATASAKGDTNDNSRGNDPDSEISPSPSPSKHPRTNTPRMVEALDKFTRERVRTYASTSEASRCLDVNRARVSRTCRAGGGIVGSYYLRFVDSENVFKVDPEEAKGGKTSPLPFGLAAHVARAKLEKAPFFAEPLPTIPVEELVRLARKEAQQNASGATADSAAKKKAVMETAKAASANAAIAAESKSQSESAPVEATNTASTGPAVADDEDGDGIHHTFFINMRDTTPITLPFIKPQLALAKPAEYAARVQRADEWDRRLGIEVGSPKKRKRKKGDGYTSEANDDSPTKGKGSKKKKRDPNAPKTVLRAYNYFVQAMAAKWRHESQELMANFGKNVAVRWKALTEEEKKPYEELSAKDKERYQREMAEYREKIKREGGEVPETPETKLKKKSKKKENSWEYPAKPAKEQGGTLDDDDDDDAPPPSSGYMLFAREAVPTLRQEFPEHPAASLMKVVADTWNSLAMEKRDRFDRMAKEKAAEGSGQMKALETPEKSPIDGGILASLAGASASKSEQKKKRTVAKLLKSEPAGESFGEGWIVKTFERQTGNTAGTCDRYWFSPATQKKFRSMVEVREFVNHLNQIKKDQNTISEADAEKLAFKAYKSARRSSKKTNDRSSLEGLGSPAKADSDKAVPATGSAPTAATSSVVKDEGAPSSVAMAGDVATTSVPVKVVSDINVFSANAQGQGSVEMQVSATTSSNGGIAVASAKAAAAAAAETVVEPPPAVSSQA